MALLRLCLAFTLFAVELVNLVWFVLREVTSYNNGKLFLFTISVRFLKFSKFCYRKWRARLQFWVNLNDFWISQLGISPNMWFYSNVIISNISKMSIHQPLWSLNHLFTLLVLNRDFWSHTIEFRSSFIISNFSKYFQWDCCWFMRIYTVNRFKIKPNRRRRKKL